MKNPTTKEMLWQQFVEENDSKAFEALFFHLNSRLIKFCIYYVHLREVAEEIVSDVFVKCWQNRENLQHIENPETYLFVCVKNQSLNYNKKMSSIHLVNIDEHTTELIDTASPDLKMEKKELLLKLDSVIETLPLQCKIVFRLVKEDGMKCKEVADILSLSVRTVHTQLFRAMGKLSLLMKEYDRSVKKEEATKYN
ncbi:RNA polymerase sigma-70 factor [Pedobacter frigidisoli]|uniref:RNA polymerase sigma-70 factor n=1 Tax=Pedobacter frigidisoli TaxID=2530455 RepID=A0A4R0NW37_9SPHI|nr:RNA polymerase sigma-70 factor [Pedobacter frigidisoli]TCD05901.1 RNA polymerase sigma-70 factor [Pedobacter frigidisoli]